MAIGVLLSAGLAILVNFLEDAIRSDAGLGGYVFAGGVFLTVVLANRYIGGAKDF